MTVKPSRPNPGQVSTGGSALTTAIIVIVPFVIMLALILGGSK